MGSRRKCLKDGIQLNKTRERRCKGVSRRKDSPADIARVLWGWRATANSLGRAEGENNVKRNYTEVQSENLLKRRAPHCHTRCPEWGIRCRNEKTLFFRCGRLLLLAALETLFPKKHEKVRENSSKRPSDEDISSRCLGHPEYNRQSRPYSRSTGKKESHAVPSILVKGFALSRTLAGVFMTLSFFLRQSSYVQSQHKRST